MSTKTKFAVLGAFIILSMVGVVAGTTSSSADVISACNSATFNGHVTTNGNSTTVWFEWGSTSSLGQRTPSQTFGSDSDFSQLVTGLSPSATYYYRAMAQNIGGTSIGDTISFQTPACPNHPPTLTLNGNSNMTINLNQSFNDPGATAFDQEDGDITSRIVKSGFVNTSVVGTYTLTYNVSDSQGSAASPVTRNVTVTGQPPVGTTQNSNPSCSTAVLNGHVSPNGNTATVWFEWGTTQSLGQSTPQQTFSSDTDFSQNISGLTENSTYYFRAVAQNSIGTSRGSILSFTTNICTFPPSVSLTVDSASIQYGSSTTVRWTSNNATSCSGTGGANGWSGSKATSGSFFTGNLFSDTTFQITCTNNAGATAHDTKTVSVGPQPPQNPTVNLTVDSSNVQYGGSTTVRWNSTNATSCSGVGGANGWSGSKSLSGSFFTGTLFSDTTFQITCNNSSGSANDQKTITVASQPPQNPTVSLTVDSASIQYGGTTTVRWTSTNATSCIGTGGANGWSSGLKSPSGSFFTGTLFSDTTFQISCTSSSGLSASDFKTINVGQAPVLPPRVVTLPPTVRTW